MNQQDEGLGLSLDDLLSIEQGEKQEQPLVPPPVQGAVQPAVSPEPVMQNVDKLLQARTREPILGDLPPPDELDEIEEAQSPFKNTYAMALRAKALLGSQFREMVGSKLEGDTAEEKMARAQSNLPYGSTAVQELYASAGGMQDDWRPEVVKELGRKMQEKGKRTWAQYEEDINLGKIPQPEDFPELKDLATKKGALQTARVLPGYVATQAGPAVAAMVLSGGRTAPPVVVSMVQPMAERFKEAKDLGLDDAQARQHVEQGMITDAAMNSLVFENLKRVPYFDKALKDTVTDPALRQRVMALTGRLASTVGISAAEEGTTRVLDNASLQDKGLDISLWDQVPEEAVYGGLAGGGMHVTVEGAGVVGEKLREREERKGEEALVKAEEVLLPAEIELLDKHIEHAALDAMAARKLKEDSEKALEELTQTTPPEDPAVTETLELVKAIAETGKRKGGNFPGGEFSQPETGVAPKVSGEGREYLLDSLVQNPTIITQRAPNLDDTRQSVVVGAMGVTDQEGVGMRQTRQTLDEVLRKQAQLDANLPSPPTGDLKAVEISPVVFDGNWVKARVAEMEEHRSRVLKSYQTQLDALEKQLNTPSFEGAPDAPNQIVERPARWEEKPALVRQYMELKDKMEAYDQAATVKIASARNAAGSEDRFWDLARELAKQARKILPREINLVVQPTKDHMYNTKWDKDDLMAHPAMAGANEYGSVHILNPLGLGETVMMELNPEKLLSRSMDKDSAWADTISTFWHEMGHTLIQFAIDRLPMDMKRVLLHGYRENLAKAFQGLTVRQWLLQNMGPVRMERLLWQLGETSRTDLTMQDLNELKENRAYHLQLLGIADSELAQISNMKAEEFFARSSPGFMPSKKPKTAVEMFSRSGVFNAFHEYVLSLPEWVAEQTARNMAVTKEGRVLTETAMSKALGEIEKTAAGLYHGNEQLMSSFPAVEKMLEWLGRKNTADNLFEVEQELKYNRVKLAEQLRKRGNPEDFNAVNEDLLRKDAIIQDSLMRGSILGSGDFRGDLSVRSMLQASLDSSTSRGADALQLARDNMGRAKANVLTLLQMASENSHVKGLQRFVRTMEAWSRAKTQRNVKADTMLRALKYGKRSTDMATRLRMAETLKAQELGRGLQPQELVALAQEEGIAMTEQTMRKYELIKKFLDHAIDELSVVLEENVRKRLAAHPDRMNLEITTLRERIKKARSMPYFPLSRFGDFMTRVVAAHDVVIDGVKYKAGDTLLAEAWETRAEADEALALTKKNPQYKGHQFLTDSISKKQKIYMGIPPGFLNEIKSFIPPEHQGDLMVALSRAAPGDGYMKRFIKRRGIEGFSRNGYRALQSYYISFNHFVSRAQFHDDFHNSIADVEQSIADVKAKGISGDLTHRRTMIEMMQKAYDDAMNPVNEWDFISAAAFQWHLAWIPMKAFMNWTQIPAITYPYLAARYGDLAANGQLLKAQRDAFKSQFMNLKPHEKRMFQLLEEEGSLHNTQVSALVGSQHSTLLHRMLPSPSKADAAYEMFSKVAEVGSWMFQHSEIYTRRIAALAAYRLELEQQRKMAVEKGKKLTPLREAWMEKNAILAAKNAVQGSLYEYSHWNRPAFMRGRTKPLFVFWNYLQHTLHFMGNDPGAARAIVLCLGLAGATGLPFAEDIMELATWLGRQFNKHFNKEVFPADVKTWVRKELAGIVRKLGEEDQEGIVTDVVLRGASSYGFGIPWLAERAGVPLGYFDLHNSMSLGSVVPGLPALNANSQEEFIAKLTEDVLGAGFTAPLGLLKAGYDTTGNDLRQWSMLAPTGIKNPLTAVDAYMKREMQTRTGAQLVEFDPTSIQHQTELIMMGLGAPSTRVNLARQRAWAAQSEAAYYVGRKQLLLNAVVMADMEDDREGLADALRAIEGYNKSLPYKELRITGMDVARARRSRKKSNANQERFRPRAKDERRIYQSVEDSYPEGESFYTEPTD